MAKEGWYRFKGTKDGFDNVCEDCGLSTRSKKCLRCGKKLTKKGHILLAINKKRELKLNSEGILSSGRHKLKLKLGKKWEFKILGSSGAAITIDGKVWDIFDNS